MNFVGLIFLCVINVHFSKEEKHNSAILDLFGLFLFELILLELEILRYLKITFLKILHSI